MSNDTNETTGAGGDERQIPAKVGPTYELARAEIDQQVATAKAYPRSMKRFLDDCLGMATLTEEIASECIYALPRDGRNIEGPSARLAEIVASSWGNCRAGARVVHEDAEFVTAQGRFHDLERNVGIEYEVRRRITDKKGRRYSSDMIGVTGNAACSIALRNAVFRGVPKALWSSVYDAARRCAVGDAQTLANRRAKAMETLQKMGATREQVLALLGVAGEQDVTLDHLATLRGLVTAIKEGTTTVDEAFAGAGAEDPRARGASGLASRLGVPKAAASPAAVATTSSTASPAEEPTVYPELPAALSKPDVVDAPLQCREPSAGGSLCVLSAGHAGKHEDANGMQYGRLYGKPLVSKDEGRRLTAADAKAQADRTAKGTNLMLAEVSAEVSKVDPKSHPLGTMIYREEDGGLYILEETMGRRAWRALEPDEFNGVGRQTVVEHLIAVRRLESAEAAKDLTTEQLLRLFASAVIR